MTDDTRTTPRSTRYFWPATGQQPNVRQSVCDALLAYGLIHQSGTRYLGQVLGQPITAPLYEVPLDVHMQWCEWCSQNVSDEALS